MTTDHDSYDQQYIATHASRHAPAVTVEDETPRFGLLPHESTDLWEETAFALVAECGDHDLLMWTAGYLMEANGRGVWIDKASAERDMMLIAVPRSQRGTMTDNAFVRTGWHRGERFARDAVRIERVFEPRDDRAPYDELYAAYRELYRALQPTHAILAGLRRQAVPTS